MNMISRMPWCEESRESARSLNALSYKWEAKTKKEE